MTKGYRVCVKVVDCFGEPIEGADVEFWDVDPIQNDHLKSADGKTDEKGQICSDLSPKEFKATPIQGVGLEGGAGPNLFFKVAAPSGSSLVEDPSAGWAPEREAHPGETLYVTLALCDEFGCEIAPMFTHIGDFKVNVDFEPTGLTKIAQAGHGGPKFAFHRVLSLLGQIPATCGDAPVRYRFLWAPSWGGPSTAITGTNLVDEGLVGYRYIQWTNNSPGGGSGKATQEIWLHGGPPAGSNISSGPGPLPERLYIAPDPYGWITIPQDAIALTSLLLNFDTTGVHAGGQAALGVNGVFGTLKFEAQAGSVPIGAASQPLYINNWAPIHTLKIDPAPCDAVTNHLDLTYAFDHEFPHSWDLEVTSPSPDGHHPKLAMGPRGGSGTHTVESNPTFSNSQNPLPNWQPCVYTASFTSRVKLTNGYVDAGTSAAVEHFCKCEV